MMQPVPGPGIPLRWPLVTTQQNRGSDLTKDARIVNAYAELDQQSGGYMVRKRVGLLKSPYVTASGIGRGMYYWSQISGTGDIFFILGNTLYRDGVSIGTIAPPVATTAETNGLHRFVQIRNPTNLVVAFADGANGYFTNGVTVTHITDVNFPPTFCPGWAYLNGYLYVMTYNGAIMGTANVDDPAVWDPLNVIIARTEPDGGVCLTKNLVYVVALKEWTTEIFYDSGITESGGGSTLRPVQGGFIPYGCLSAATVQDMDGTLLWAALGKKSPPQVVRMDNLQVTVISTPAVERLLKSAPGPGYLSFCFKSDGHRFYGLTIKSLNRTLIYDLDQNLWYPWTDPDGNYFPIIANTVDVNGSQLFQHETNGLIYYASEATHSDDLIPFPVDIYTPNFDAGVGRKKHLSQMMFNADRVAGSVLNVRCNDYDYDPDKWTNFRQVRLGNQVPTLENCGTFRRRAYHFRHQADTAFRIDSIDLQLDIGTL